MRTIVKLCMLLAFVVIVVGITRLTDSGLGALIGQVAMVI